MATALEKHLALIGFMGAGKSTLAPLVGERLGRRAIDVDDELGVDVPSLFAQGEDAFRAVEERVTCELLEHAEPAVLALGGGAITSEAIRDSLARRAFTVLVDVDVETAWKRVKETDRPLAQDEAAFRRLNDERRPLYGGLADAVAHDVDGIVLAAAGVHVEAGALERLGELVPGDGAVALVADPRVNGIHGPTAQVALGARLHTTHELAEGEQAKTIAAVTALWQELRLDRTRGVLVALGGGCTTDAAGFAAATYLRGVPWVAVPTTLVGQVDAAIGGKTAINLPTGKNFVGAFHWPLRTVIDPTLLTTLGETERRDGMAEVVKTGLLAGEPFWELPEPELVRRCAAYKAGICLRDPRDEHARTQLNLGHTFAHALEAGSDHAVSHGEAVALGLVAALRISGRDESVVHEVLEPEPVRADRERAWAALQRDKKRRDDRIRLVLLGDEGPVVEPVDPALVRRELDLLIAE